MSQFDHLLIPSITMWDMFQLQKFENNIPEGEKSGKDQLAMLD